MCREFHRKIGREVNSGDRFSRRCDRRECSKCPALGSVYTRSSSVACACIVYVNYYITKHHITTTDFSDQLHDRMKSKELYIKHSRRDCIEPGSFKK